MDQSTKAGGNTTKPTVKEDSFTHMEMSMRVSGKMIRLTAMAFTTI